MRLLINCLWFAGGVLLVLVIINAYALPPQLATQPFSVPGGRYDAD
jgi:hypothetical protein